MPRSRRAVLVCALAACSGEQPKKAPPATPVRIATAVTIDAPVNVIASGVVEPMQTVAVTTQVSGNLLDVLFKEGDFVQQGQVLFRIDPRSLQAAADQARATLGRDEAQAEAASKDDARYKTLADMGYVSRSEADQKHAAAAAAAATVEADRAALRSAQVELGYTTIRAPITGRTGSVLVRKGNNVSPGGSPLVVINQISPVLVRFPVLDQDFPSVQRALALHALHVRAVASDSSQASDEGQLTFLDNAVDSLTGTVTGKATFPNTGRKLWPGELVFLTVLLDIQRNVIAVPTDAVLTGQQGTYVYVVDVRNTVKPRDVVSGAQVRDLTVIASGLAPGERVVTDGQSRLNPGSRVAIIGTGADTGATGRLGRGGGRGSGESSTATPTSPAMPTSPAGASDGRRNAAGDVAPARPPGL